MLVDEVVDPGWLTEKQFYQGFALVQVRVGAFRWRGGARPVPRSGATAKFAHVVENGITSK